MEAIAKSVSNGRVLDKLNPALSPVQSEILEALGRLEPYSATLEKLSEITGQHGGHVRYALSRLEEKGLIRSKAEQDKTFYCVANGSCRKVSTPSETRNILDELKDLAQVNGWNIEKLVAKKTIPNGWIRVGYGFPDSEEAD